MQVRLCAHVFVYVLFFCVSVVLCLALSFVCVLICFSLPSSSCVRVFILICFYLLSVFLHVFLSACLSALLFFVFLSLLCLSVFRFRLGFCLLTYMCVCLCLHVCVSSSVCLSSCLSGFLPVWVYLSVYPLSAYLLRVCLCILQEHRLTYTPTPRHTPVTPHHKHPHASCHSNLFTHSLPPLPLPPSPLSSLSVCLPLVSLLLPYFLLPLSYLPF